MTHPTAAPIINWYNPPPSQANSSTSTKQSQGCFMESIVLEMCSLYMPGSRDPKNGEEFPGRWRHNNLMLCLLSTTQQLQNLDHEIPSIHHEISIHCIYVRMTSLSIRQLMDLLMWLGAPPLITCFFNLTRNNRGGPRDASFIKAQYSYICVGLLRKRWIC